MEETEAFKLTEEVPNTWQLSQCSKLRNGLKNVGKIQVGLGM